ncbi:hypothetical protein IIF7_16837 [Zunongwangia atlantica 22II14-10F7]|uniref:DUF4172 domain-containing protein n=1 Tax=Zunongwangia atlantica 22II14-10F7 TaxID=1185767 RepID=A0A1Y1T117_9FLAO|nr:hypothetical protein IIF7_16837 [Zunongwangia atlantica 22II14-10F7]
MAWNWQLKNWPGFEFNSEVLLPLKMVFYKKRECSDTLIWVRQQYIISYTFELTYPLVRAVMILEKRKT